MLKLSLQTVGESVRQMSESVLECIGKALAWRSAFNKVRPHSMASLASSAIALIWSYWTCNAFWNRTSSWAVSRELTCISGCVRINSPTKLSYVNPCAPWPMESTRMVEEEYRQYPAAKRLDPGWQTLTMQFSMSFWGSFLSSKSQTSLGS